MIGTFAVIYDQGVSIGHPVNNQWLLVLDGVKQGTLFSRGFASFNDSGVSLSTIYDVYPYMNKLLVAGKKNYTDPYLMVYCELLFAS